MPCAWRNSSTVSLGRSTVPQPLGFYPSMCGHHSICSATSVAAQRLRHTLPHEMVHQLIPSVSIPGCGILPCTDLSGRCNGCTACPCPCVDEVASSGQGTIVTQSKGRLVHVLPALPTGVPRHLQCLTPLGYIDDSRSSFPASCPDSALVQSPILTQAGRIPVLDDI